MKKTMTKTKAAAVVSDGGQAHSAVPHVIPGTSIRMRRLTGERDHVPHARPFVFDPKQVRDIAIATRLGMNVMLTGPTGCGKTSVIAALAAELNRPLIRFNCDGETRVSNLRGMMKPASKDGVLTLTFSPGDLAVAMREGYWVLLDEIDAALPSVLFVLQPVLEEGSRTLHVPETKQSIQAHSEFAIFATGNTVGYRAAMRSKFSGTNQLNSAFLDRFGCVVACDYPEREEEIKRVRAHVTSDNEDLKDCIDGACRVAEHLRGDTNFRSDLSTRRLIQWARLMEEYSDDPTEQALHTFELAVARKFDNPLDAKIAREVVRRIFGFEGSDARTA